MNLTKAILLLSIFILIALAAFAAAPDFVGTWVGKTEIPDQGVDQITFVVKKTNTVFTGTISDSMGMIAPETPVTDIKVDGNTFSFRFPLTDSSIVVNAMKVDGDKMTGTWELSDGMTGTFNLERKK